MKDGRRQNIKLFVFLVVYCFAVLMFCSGASPIIDYMTTDSSVFFVMGRGMKSGLVPYRDIFDHKGFYLYGLNCLAALISDRSSIGIVMLEAVFFSFNAYSVYKIFQIHGQGHFCSLTAALIFTALAVNYFTYQRGNLTETWGMTLQLASIYFVCRDNTEDGMEHRPGFMMLHGIFVAAAFGLRANLVFMWFGIAVVVLFRLACYKKYANLVYNILMGMLGVVLGLCPMILYGIFTGSLEEMYFASIEYNLMYADVDQKNVFATLAGFFRNPTTAWIFILLIVSLLIMVKMKNIGKWQKGEYAAMLLFSILSVCISGRGYGHYFEYLVPFLLPVIGWGLARTGRILKDGINIWKKAAIIVLCFVFSLAVNLSLPIKLFADNQSTPYVEAAYDCKEKLEELEKLDEDTKVLVTGNNALFYNKMGVLPSVKYFYIPSNSYKLFPDPVDEQINSILSGENDVLVVFFADYENRVVYSEADNNDEILEVLESEYDRILEKPDFGMELYVKK